MTVPPVPPKLQQWTREREREPFDAAAWNRFPNWASGNLAAPLNLVDVDGGETLAVDPAAKTVAVAAPTTVSATADFTEPVTFSAGGNPVAETTAAGDLRMENAHPLTSWDAAKTTVINLIRAAASGVIESGAVGTQHNLLGTVVAPVAAAPTAPGQVTAASVASGRALFTGSSGAVLDTYNIASVARTSAGLYRVTWTKPFATVNYMVIASCEHASSLLARVVTKTTTYADVEYVGWPSTPTDPTAAMLVAYGALAP